MDVQLEHGLMLGDFVAWAKSLGGYLLVIILSNMLNIYSLQLMVKKSGKLPKTWE